MNWLKVKNRLCEIILKGFSRAIFDSLLKEIPKTLSKDKRKRKSTLKALEMEVSFLNLYSNLKVESVENQYVKEA